MSARSKAGTYAGQPRLFDYDVLSARGMHTEGPDEGLRFVDGFEVRVTRKRGVRSVRIRVVPPDGHVEATLPWHVRFADLESFIRSKAAWIEEQQRALQGSPQVLAELAGEDEKKMWRQVVAATVPVLVEHYAPLMGVQVGKLAYRNMKSRWGSCQPSTGRICINTRLALYPPECLEYVVVHELAHLLEPGHGPRFKAILDAFLPNWRHARDLLKA